MKKNTGPGMRYIALTVFFVFVASACTPRSYDFIGNWTQKAGTLTYVNRDQHMQVTFPNDRWRVHTEPTDDFLKMIWTAPTKDKPAFHVMHAQLGEQGMNAQIEIEPVSEDLDLEYYVAIHRQRLERVRGIEVLSSYLGECGGRSIGLTVVKGTSGAAGPKGIKIITAIFKEEGRFTLLTLACPEPLFESGKDQFWQIADSYQYID